MAKDQTHEQDQAGDTAAGSEQAVLAGLLLAASRGQESAWRAILDRYTGRVFALTKSRCRDADLAEELTQSVFVAVATKLSSGLYTEQGRFESWLFRVTMNRVRDHIRRVRRQGVLNAGDEVLDRRPADVSINTEADERLSPLREALEQLSDADREIVELRHHGGLSFKQMAELLDEPVGTLLARHHRALKKLKEWIEIRAGRSERSRIGESHRDETNRRGTQTGEVA